MQLTNNQRKRILDLILPAYQLIEDESYAYEIVQMIADMLEEDDK